MKTNQTGEFWGGRIYAVHMKRTTLLMIHNGGAYNKERTHNGHCRLTIHTVLEHFLTF